MLRDRPAWEGDPREPPVDRATDDAAATTSPTTRLPGDERTARLPDDPSRAETTRLDDAPTRGCRGPVGSADAARAAPDGTRAALGRRRALTAPLAASGRPPIGR